MTEQYDGFMFCHSWTLLSKLKAGLIDALGRSSDKPRMEFVRTRTER